MKKTYLLLISLFTVFCTYSQAPDAFNYQAVIRNDEGALAANQNVTFRFEIFSNATEINGGTKVYSEIHQVNTDEKGTANLVIGTGTPVSGSFSAIDWSKGAFFVKVSLDKGNGFSNIGEQQLLNVPYVQYADAAGNLINKSQNETLWGMVVGNNGEISTVPFPKGYTRMVWNDEFSGTGLPDDTKWDYEHGYIRYGELQYYTKERVENAYQQDGLLHLVARCDSSVIDGAMRPISSASIHTKGKAAWQYGYVEVKAKVPYLQGIGTWPAIWMMPRDDFYGFWPRSGEIDIMEYVASDYRYVHFSQHSYVYTNENGANKHKTTKSYCPTAYTEFHTFGLAWTPETMIWYLDGVQKFKVNNVEHLWNTWPFNKPFYLILNLAMGGWGGATDNQLLKNNPQDYQIDYVRIFQ